MIGYLCEQFLLLTICLALVFILCVIVLPKFSVCVFCVSLARCCYYNNLYLASLPANLSDYIVLVGFVSSILAGRLAGENISKIDQKVLVLAACIGPRWLSVSRLEQ